MSVLSTDVMALACILGSAAVGGVVTVAALDRDDGSQVACLSEMAEMAAVDPTVVLSIGGESGTIVVAPKVRVRAVDECAPVVVDVDREVRIHMERVRSDLERVRVRSEEARAQMEEARARVEEARMQVRAMEAGQLQAEIEAQMDRMEQELARLDDGTVR